MRAKLLRGCLTLCLSGCVLLPVPGICVVQCEERFTSHLSPSPRSWRKNPKQCYHHILFSYSVQSLAKLDLVIALPFFFSVVYSPPRLAFRSFFGFFLLVLALFLLLVCTPLCALGAEHLTILHSSEHHGVALPLSDPGLRTVGGMAGRATLIQKVKEETEAVLIVDSGDILIGTALSSWFRGEPDVKAMNLMGYHAMAAGNHDFDFGLEHLQKLQGLATFPILCTNLTGRDVDLPCKHSATIQIGKLTVGLMGIVGNSNFPDTFNREVVKALELRDPVETVRRQARRWKEAGTVDVVVVITHQDTEEDRKLLKDVPYLDVIIGGHTEGFDGLFTPNATHPVDEVQEPGAVYVKTHRQGRTLGRLNLLIDKGRVTWAKAQNLPVTASVTPDQTVHQLLQRYLQRFAKQAHEVVGRSLVTLIGESEKIRTQETNLGSLLADLLRKEFGQEIALVNSGQIRATIPAGSVNLGKVLSVLPFDSSVVTLSLTGQQIFEALENSVRLLPRQSGRFLQVSGLQVTYDVSAPPGARVTKVKVGGQPLDLERTYSVGTDGFLADGGDGYAMFKQASKRVDHQIPIRDVLLKALAHAPLMAQKDHRIRFVETPRSPSHKSRS